MTKPLAVLLAATAAVWVLLALPATLFMDGPPLTVTALAAGVCLVPAVLTLVLMHHVRHRPPEEKVVLVLLCTILRLGLAIGGGVLAYYTVAAVHDHTNAFLLWGVVFYLVTLAVETGLLYRDASRISRTSQPGAQGS